MQGEYRDFFLSSYFIDFQVGTGISVELLLEKFGHNNEKKIAECA